MNKSESVNELAAALAKAQGEITGALRDSDNPFYKSKYADLESVWAACRGPLTKHGLSIVQAPHSVTSAEGKVNACVTTMLLHASGQWLEETCECPLAEVNAQKLTAAITYLRRTGVAAFASVAPTDDDGESTAGRGDAKPTAAREAMNAKSETSKVEPTNTSSAALDTIQHCIREMAAKNGEEYEPFKKKALAWVKSEFGYAKRGDFADLSTVKTHDVCQGLRTAFSPMREPGDEPTNE